MADAKKKTSGKGGMGDDVWHVFEDSLGAYLKNSFGEARLLGELL